jgi:uncharacterized protein YkwD
MRPVVFREWNMKKYAVLALAVSAAFAGQARAVTAAPVVVIDQFESRVLELVNDERSFAGLSALSFDVRLQSAAEAHSLDMATNGCFAHNSCDGTAWSTRVYRYYPKAGIGENIAAGYLTPEAVVTGWMNSPGHRANILNGAFQGIGVGYVYLGGSRSGTYWTQDFGTLAAVPLPVPEPEIYTMLLAGLALLGGVARRRYV